MGGYKENMWPCSPRQVFVSCWSSIFLDVNIFQLWHLFPKKVETRPEFNVVRPFRPESILVGFPSVWQYHAYSYTQNLLKHEPSTHSTWSWCKLMQIDAFLISHFLTSVVTVTCHDLPQFRVQSRSHCSPAMAAFEAPVLARSPKEQRPPGLFDFSSSAGIWRIMEYRRQTEADARHTTPISPDSVNVNIFQADSSC